MSEECNLLVAQSGGPTAAINASLAGIIKAALASEKIDKVYGAINGIKGFMEKKVLNLSDMFGSAPDKIETLSCSPAMFLGSCRYRLAPMEKDLEDYLNVFGLFKVYNIKYFLYIGGNDSMDTVLKLSDYAKQNGYDISIIGVPKTIDNDLNLTDHTPGYGSAAKYIASSMLEIAHDAYIYNVDSVTIVEIMGRNVGWLTAAAALARNEYSKAPHLIYLPERNFDEDQFIEDIKSILTHSKHVIVAVSEGLHDSEGRYISADSGNVDNFGHVMLSGAGKYLERLVNHRIGCKVRSIELNVLQRCAGHISSLTDINEAIRLGECAVGYVTSGNSGQMLVIKRTGNDPYSSEFELASIYDIANKEKRIPDEWINEAGNDVTDEIIEYIKPLTIGETNIKYKDGLPEYLPVGHLFS